MTVLSPVLVQRFCDNNGNPLFGGQLYSYEAGTTTPLATYTDSTGVTANTNPVILNARGEANVWVPPNVAYKFVLEDSSGNTIWTVDNVIQQQLITLYGGVDTGALDAYAINFNAPFTTLTNGIVIYFIPSHTNTGPSTLNVNSLGVDSITNPDGSGLSARAIVSGEPCQVMRYNGFWLLLNSGYFGGSVAVKGTLSVYGVTAASFLTLTYDQGSFTPTWTGFTSSPGGTLFWTRIGATVTLFTNAAITGTSNATTMTITNLPAEIQPTRDCGIPVLGMEDNGTQNQFGQAVASHSGTITFSLMQANTSTGVIQPHLFTASGTKGFSGGFSMTYGLN